MRPATFAKLFALFCGISALAACGYDEHYYSETYYHSDAPSAPAPLAPAKPRLYSFGMVDSYGVNSNFDDTHLALSPYIDHGYFEIDWDMSAHTDYYIELRVNEFDSTSGSRVISSEYCDAGFPCDYEPYQFCEYHTDYSIACETPNGDWQSTYVGDLVHSAPQDLYFILQVCDTQFFYCEYQSLPVLME